jgi:hypothetical protein
MSSPAAAPSAMSSTIPKDVETYLFEFYDENRRSGISPDAAARIMKHLQQDNAENCPDNYNGNDAWRARWRFVDDALIAHFEHKVRLKSLYQET